MVEAGGQPRRRQPLAPRRHRRPHGGDASVHLPEVGAPLAVEGGRRGLERLLEPFRHHDRHVRHPEGDELLDVGRQVEPEPAVVDEGGDECLRHVGALGAFSQGRAAVREDDPAAPGVGRDRRQHAVRGDVGQELVEPDPEGAPIGAPVARATRRRRRQERETRRRKPRRGVAIGSRCLGGRARTRRFHPHHALGRRSPQHRRPRPHVRLLDLAPSVDAGGGEVLVQPRHGGVTPLGRRPRGGAVADGSTRAAPAGRAVTTRSRAWRTVRTRCAPWAPPTPPGGRGR